MLRIPLLIETGARYWDRQARTDPMWAILADPAKAGGGWNADDFFATGRAEAAAVAARLERLGRPTEKRRALDFGCGLGRVTQALCASFDRITGLDVSPTMVELPRRYNRFGERCEYRVAASYAIDLPSGSFDLIYSNIVRQHIRPRIAERYLGEFPRLPAPEGLLLFQLPGRAWARRPGPPGALRYWVGRNLNLGSGEENAAAGPEFESFSYAVTRC